MNQVQRPIVFLDIDGVLNSEQWYALAASRNGEVNTQTVNPGELIGALD